MSSQLQHAARQLFPDEGQHVQNVKFFLGRSRDVTADQLVGQLMSANEQIENGTALRTEDLDGDM